MQLNYNRVYERIKTLKKSQFRPSKKTIVIISELGKMHKRTY